MKNTKKIVGIVSVIALMSASATPAMAGGTTAGTQITNSATVNYSVGGISQTQLSASNTFYVDREVDVLVTKVATTRTNVTPGATDQVIAFDVKNQSNQVIDIVTSFANATSDQFDVSSVRMYVDNEVTGTIGSWDAGDTQLTTTASGYLDEVAIDDVRRVFLVANIPTSAANGNAGDVNFTVTAHAGGGAGSQGAVITATAAGTANTAGTSASDIQTVFGDAAGLTGDSASDGKHSVSQGFSAVSAALTVTKTSTVISDPINGTTNPKAIPGAVLKYCVSVANSGAVAASTVVLADTHSADLNYLGTAATSGDATKAMLATDNTCAGGTAVGTYTAASRSVTHTLTTLATSTTNTFYYFVSIK